MEFDQMWGFDKIARTPHLASFISGHEDAVIGWGRKRSGRRAVANAGRSGRPLLLLEDGFLRSVEREDPALSLVLDDLGIYYDASAPSRLENLIATPLESAQVARAVALIAAWRRHRVSKYNAAREYDGSLPQRYVLVCDQTHGDVSIAFGHADARAFGRMLDAALAENPGVPVLVKTHPDVLTRRRRGYFPPGALADPRIVPIAENCHPVRLIEKADTVYTVTSQMGFEALVWGRRVRCFGMPFYAGWGLTEDELPAPSRRCGASLSQLVHAALVEYPRYVDPETGARCAVETLLDHIGLQRRMRTQFPPRVHALGFSRWKRPILGRFLCGSRIQPVRPGARIPDGATLAVWGAGSGDAPPSGTKTIRIEDGFLRSVGLGADLIAPVSWVFDDLGLYYDARQPSRLERILLDTDFTPALIERAQALRARILDAGLTKYNLEAPRWRRPESAGHVILVPGQVEDDASIRFGAPGIKTNAGLVEAVRRAHPGAYLIYKPHPDVVAGLRAAGAGETGVSALCDAIVTEADMAQLLDEIDAVHTLTSLTGFEALLRGKAVTCHGQPFYSGWGLTADMMPLTRRARRLDIDELVAGCLILYPRYVSRVTERFTTPEQAIGELSDWRRGASGRLPAWRRALRPVLARLKRRPGGG